MGFDGFLVPDWAKPYVGYAVGTDWPEGDEDGCFRLADACLDAARVMTLSEGFGLVMEPGTWDGDALDAYLERVRNSADPALAKLVEELVTAAEDFNELGVQVEYTKRMIEVSVWFLIFQIGWLLAAAIGPWGGVTFALIGSRVRLTRLVIAQLGKRLLINAGLFAGLQAGMDLAVQLSQSRRDGVDWEQIMSSAGTGALLGGFLTVFTGVWPTRSMLGLMFRSGLASGATDFSLQAASGQPLDGERLLKNLTSGVLGGADAHWASWSPGASKLDSRPGSDPSIGSDSSFGSGPSKGEENYAAVRSDPMSAFLTNGWDSTSPSSAVWSDPTSPQPLAPKHDTDLAGLSKTTLSSVASTLDVVPTGLDSIINKATAAEAPSLFKAGEHAPAVAAPESLSQPTKIIPHPHQTGPNASPGPFQILANPGKSGDGYVANGLWGKYGAAGVVIQAEKGGEPRYLLMQQSENVSNPGKWQLPGGALDSLETPVQGAARELSEELGAKQPYLDGLKLSGELPVEVAKGWTYTNLAAEGTMFQPKLDSFETSAAKWATRQELVSMANSGQLHPALAKVLPDLVGLFHQDGEAFAAGRDAGTAQHGGPPKDGTFASYSGLLNGDSQASPVETIRRDDSGRLYIGFPPDVPPDAPFGARQVSDSFGTTVWGDTIDNLIYSEREAVIRYTGNGFIGINETLRTYDIDSLSTLEKLNPPYGRDLALQVAELDRALSRQPLPEAIDVSRSIKWREDLFDVPIEELPGTVQTDPAFMSTKVGDKSNWFHREINLHLRVPEGTPALYVDPISANRGEHELLLGRRRSFFVEDVRRKENKWHIYGWILPGESD